MLVENEWWLPRIVNGYRNRNESEKVRRKSGNDFLCLEDLLVLMLGVEKRKEEDLKRIAKIISDTWPFHQYTFPETLELIKFASLNGYRKGRELIHAGDSPFFAYFILSGSVELQGDGTDEDFGVKMIQGDIIGREEILFGELRQESCIINEDMLCIGFDKINMLSTLKPMLDRWSKISRYLMKFDVISHFDLGVLKELCKLGCINHYDAETLIDSSKTCNFLVKGEVSVIQRLVVEKYIAQGKEHFRLHHDQGNIPDDADNLEPIYMQVCVLQTRAIFGLGERMSHNIFWTKKPCKVIQYSRKDLKKHGQPAVWKGAVTFLDHIFPTTEKVFQCFLRQRKWWRVKKELTDQCNKRRSRPATIHNVPIPTRCRQTKLTKSFMERMEILEMDDYRLGRNFLTLFEEELENNVVLDQFNDIREKLLGQFKTDPRGDQSI